MLSPAPVVAVGLASHLKRFPLSAPALGVRDAREVWSEVQREHGFNGNPLTPVLSAPGNNTKIAKSVAPVWSLTLAPAMSSGLINTCVRYQDCHDVCVLTSGRGVMSSVQRSRAARTSLLYRAPEAFAAIVSHEVSRINREGWRIRLNSASDIPWETAAPWLINLIVENGGQAYDYTKSWGRSDVDGYTLVRSVDSRQSIEKIKSIVDSDRNVSVVLPVGKTESVPAIWHGMPTVDGDVSDDRTEDPAGRVVVLRAKGKLRNLPNHPLVRNL